MSLHTVQEIERAIESLTSEQIEELYRWLDHHQPQPIDTRIQADLESGRLDELIEGAVADYKAGNTWPL